MDHSSAQQLHLSDWMSSTSDNEAGAHLTSCEWLLVIQLVIYHLMYPVLFWFYIQRKEQLVMYNTCIQFGLWLDTHNPHVWTTPPQLQSGRLHHKAMDADTASRHTGNESMEGHGPHDKIHGSNGVQRSPTNWVSRASSPFDPRSWLAIAKPQEACGKKKLGEPCETETISIIWVTCGFNLSACAWRVFVCLFVYLFINVYMCLCIYVFVYVFVPSSCLFIYLVS